jgi:hypothetical protein
MYITKNTLIISIPLHYGHFKIRLKRPWIYNKKKKQCRTLPTIIRFA